MKSNNNVVNLDLQLAPNMWAKELEKLINITRDLVDWIEKNINWHEDYIEDLLKNKDFKLLENENILDSSDSTYFSLIWNWKTTKLIVSYDWIDLYLQIEWNNEKRKVEKSKQPNLYSIIDIVKQRYGDNFYF